MNKTYSLEDLVTLKYGKTIKSNNMGKTYPVYGSGGLIGFTDKFLYDKPSVLIGRKGSINKIHYVDKPFWAVDTIFFTEINEEIVLPKFLYCLMSQINFLDYNEGSSLPSLRLDTLKRLTFSVPSIEEQKKILAFINPVDEKIKLNTNMLKKLEKMGQMIIKNFPASGEIKLGEIASFICGYGFKSSDYRINGRYRIITIKNIRDGAIDSSNAAAIDNLPPKSGHKYILNIGDILISLTGNMVGKVGIVCEKNLLINQRVAKFITMRKEDLPFIYFYFRQPQIFSMIQMIAAGTAQLNISTFDICKMNINFDKNDIAKLSNTLKPLFEKICYCQTENIYLNRLLKVMIAKLLTIQTQ